MKEKKKAQRRKYDAEFKQQVLQMIGNGRPVREVAESLGIGENLIYRWRSHQEPKGAIGKENDFLLVTNRLCSSASGS